MFWKFLLLIICIVGIIYIILLKSKYQNDASFTKENIIKYFKDNNITSLERGIKPKDLPRKIIKNPYLLMMVQDKTLSFKKGKYYLN